jgi:predicted small lipoprotein YifL
VLKSRVISTLLLAGSLTLLSGCGKKGPLVPPEALAPAPVSDLALAQKGARFQVSWTAPSREEGGATLKDLAGFHLFRRIVLPPAEDCEECPTAYRELQRIELDYLKTVRRFGNSYIYDDYDITRGKTYQYKLRSFMSDGTESKDSNKARRTAMAAPPPPALEGVSGPSSVTLNFTSPAPQDGTFAGYNIYRNAVGAPIAPAPLNASPVTANSYEDKDVVIGIRYSYTVTSLVTAKGESAESVPSNRFEGGLTDRD